MKLAMYFGRTAIGDRPLDLDAVDTSPRGLTGTDGTYIGLCRTMRDLGHDVRMFVHLAPHRTWEGIRVAPAQALGDQQDFDVVLSVNDGDVFRRVHPRAVRASNNQMPDYRFARPGFHRNVDLFLPISETQWRYLRDHAHERCLDDVTYRVLPNGCDPGAYEAGVRVPGRCVYTSSPDRGLHVLCLAWPEIVRRVPHARLRIFYHSLEKWIGEGENWTTHEHPLMRETARRVAIVRRTLAEHADTIEVVGSVSRRRMARELSEAECLLYPCDTLQMTETFGCSVLEGCASGALPVISGCDAFKEIYAGACPMVPDHAERFLDAWTGLAVRAMTDATWADDWRRRGRACAERHAWPAIGERIEGYLAEAMERKKVAA